MPDYRILYGHRKRRYSTCGYASTHGLISCWYCANDLIRKMHNDAPSTESAMEALALQVKAHKIHYGWKHYYRTDGVLTCGVCGHTLEYAVFAYELGSAWADRWEASRKEIQAHNKYHPVAITILSLSDPAIKIDNPRRRNGS